MARRSRGTLYRKTKIKVGRTGTPRKVKVGFYRCRYRDNRGELCDHTLRLPNGRGTTDRDVAGAALDEILKRLDRGKPSGSSIVA